MFSRARLPVLMAAQGRCSALAWLLAVLLAAGCGSGTVDTGGPTPTVDTDHDGYTTEVDCDDSDAAVHPGMAEVCGDSVDQDCSGLDLACAADTTPPVLIGGQPTGILSGGTTQTTLRVTTNEAATCKWSTSAATSYAAMANTFTTTGTSSHNTVVTGLADGQSYTYYVRCQDGAGNATTADYAVTFSVGTGTGPLSVSLVPSRTSGVAPLSVFFDASGTTDASVTSRPFHDLEYRWDFGDPLGSPVSGTTWATGSGAGSNSRNAALGPVAAHVFEVPGTYTVALSVFDGINSANAETTVTVSDPEAVFAGTSTVCFSASGTFTGCPSGATQVTTSDFVAAIAAHQATGKRLLFRRTETFTAASSASITATGPGLVGAFGTGVAPRVQMSGATAILLMSSPATPDIGDWRVMDLELDGLSHGDSLGIKGEGGIDRLTLLRVDAHDIGEGFNFGASFLNWYNAHGNPGHHIWDQLTIVDCAVRNVIGGGTSGATGSFVAARRLTFLGNAYDDTTQAQHVLRLTYVDRGVVGNSTLSRPATGRLILKLHGPTWCDATSPVGSCLTPDSSPPATVDYGYLTNTPPIDVTSLAGGSGYTEKVLIADNELTDAINDWSVALGPQNAQKDERLRDIIVERNWFVAGSGTQVALLVWGTDTTVRNNICDRTGALAHLCFRVEQHGVEPPPTNVHLYSNTFYSADASGSGIFAAIGIDATATDVSIANNLASAPLATSVSLLQGTGASGAAQSNNLVDNAPEDLFVSATPAAPADFILKALPNPARDTGASTVLVFSDFFGTPRPLNGVPDLGAVEGQ